MCVCTCGLTTELDVELITKTLTAPTTHCHLGREEREGGREGWVGGWEKESKYGEEGGIIKSHILFP